MATELAAAYVTLIPSLKGAQRTIQSQLNGVNLDPVTKKMGGSITSGIGGAFKTAAKVGVGALAGITGAIGGLAASGGITRALNIEQAQFKLRNLGMDVEKTMASCNEAVSGTAFGLDAAATVASNLGASGVAAGDDMTQSLKAVAGVAAMSGSTMEDVGLIFGKVAATGRLQGDESLQFAERGINATAALAQYLGSTSQEVQAMVSDGKISFETFSDAMYASFGDAAYGANELFSGAMSNVRAALSRIGAKFATPALGGLRKIFVALIPAIDGVSKALDPAVAAFTAWIDGTVPKVIDGINNAANGITNFSEKMATISQAGGFSALILNAIAANKTISLFKTTIDTVFSSIPSKIDQAVSSIQNAISLIRSYFSAINLNAGSAISAFGYIGLAVAGMQQKFSFIKSAGDLVADLTSKLGSLASRFAGVGVSSAAITAAIVPATNALNAFVNTASTRLAAISPIFSQIGTKLSGSIGAAVAAVTPMFERFGVAAGVVGTAASPALKVASAFMKIFNPVAMLISSFATMYIANETYRNSVNSLLASIGTSLMPIFQTLGTTLLTIATAILPVINNLFNALTPIFGQLALAILQVVAAVAPLVTQLVSTLAPVIAQIVVAFSQFANAVIPIVAAAFNVIVSAIQAAMPVITAIATVVVSVISTVISVIGTIVSTVTNIASVVTSVIGVVVSAISGVASTVMSVLGGVGSFVGGIINTIVSTISGGFNMALGIVQGIANGIGGAISGLFSTVSSIFGNIASTITTIVGNIKSKAISIFTNIVSGIGSKINSIKTTIQNGFNTAVNFITGLASKAWNWGADIIGNITSGIKDKIGGITNAVSGVADTIKKFLHFSEPDVGPLSDFHTYMPDMMKGIASGIENNLGIVRRAVGSASGVISDGLSGWDSTFGYSYSPSVNAAPMASAGNTYIIDGITYGDTDVHISSAIDQLIRATRIAKRS